jgi:exonuclease SbcC
MYPKLLRLENFLSYSQPTELNFDLFDLAVLTGRNGAGKSSLIDALTWTIWGKARYKSDDFLVSHNKEYTQTEVILAENEKQYRILRYHKKGKNPKTFLEFFVSSDGKHWQSLTEKTIRLTEAKIVATLKLPYEVFSNSCLLRQGKADEFTIKTPSERKAVLSELLLLSEWDRRQEILKEEARAEEVKFHSLEISIANLEKEKEDSALLKKELKATEERLEKIVEKKKELERKIKKLQEIKIELSGLIAEKNRLANQYNEQANRLKLYLQEQEELKNAISKLKQALKQKSQIKNDYERWLTVNKELAQLNKAKKEFDNLKNREKELCQQKELITERLKTLLFGLDEQIKTEETDLKRKIAEINSIIRCPTCYREFRSIKEKEETKKLLEKESYLKIQKLREEIEKIKKNEQIKRARIEEELELLKKKFEKLAFNSSYYENLEAESIQLAEKSKLFQDIEALEKTLLEKKTRLSSLSSEIERTKKELEKIKTQGFSLKEAIEKQEKDLKPLKQLETEAEILLEDEQATREKRVLLSSRLLESQKREEQLKRLKEEATSTKEKLSDLKILSDACGRSGIQAMIIEEAIPLLEEKANMLLNNLSDGMLSLNIETEKEKRSGEGLIETLEIIVSDSMGSRPYELFSGGEAFRINLAIRLALSMLLTERLGSKVEFLIIDEGFGSLDLQGREALINTLQIIKKYFQKIIVITHIDELKEAFPTEIQVTKEAAQSRLTFLKHAGSL